MIHIVFLIKSTFVSLAFKKGVKNLHGFYALFEKAVFIFQCKLTFGKQTKSYLLCSGPNSRQ